jgi:hypothetical protein
MPIFLMGKTENVCIDTPIYLEQHSRSIGPPEQIESWENLLSGLHHHHLKHHINNVWLKQIQFTTQLDRSEKRKVLFSPQFLSTNSTFDTFLTYYDTSNKKMKFFSAFGLIPPDLHPLCGLMAREKKFTSNENFVYPSIRITIAIIHSH